jgi:glycyl-tRNA synthetase beta chain
LAKNLGNVVLPEVDQNLLVEQAEKNLFAALEAKQEQNENFLSRKAYQELLIDLASLNGPISQFFDDVLVMAEDDKLRYNRLALLQRIRNLFIKVADISLLQA